MRRKKWKEEWKGGNEGVIRDKKTHRETLYINIRAVLASFELGLRFGYSAVVVMARGAQKQTEFRGQQSSPVPQNGRRV